MARDDHPGAYMQRFEARGLTYLPTASYAEMMQWAMPAASAAEYERLTHGVEQEGRGDLVKYMRGGFWRFFLAKYPEANSMHKRGLRIDEKLAQADSTEAREALWAAQCNCPYWHGVFGGLYLRHIRATTNSNLVRAERLADERAGASGVKVTARDFDFDGHDELLVQSPDVSLLLHPKAGGMLTELDLRRRDHAFLDVLTRRWEAYHEALRDGAAHAIEDVPSNIHGAVRLKQEGLAELLVFDHFRRGALQEWMLDDGASPEQFARGEAAWSFDPSGEWGAVVERSRESVSLTLEREAGGWRVEKRVKVPANGERLDIGYACTNVGDDPRSAIFVSEWNLAMPQAAGGDDRTALLDGGGDPVDLNCAGTLTELREFGLRGSASYQLRCEMDSPMYVWHYPVDSISSSEGGVERVRQGVAVALVRHVALGPGERVEFDVAWRVRELG